MKKKHEYYVYKKKKNIHVIADGYDMDILGMKTFETNEDAQSVIVAYKYAVQEEDKKWFGEQYKIIFAISQYGRGDEFEIVTKNEEHIYFAENYMKYEDVERFTQLLNSAYKKGKESE